MQSLTKQAVAPYGEQRVVKGVRLLAELNELTAWHNQHCKEYRRILDVMYGGRRKAMSLEEVPFLPVRLFKTIELVSVPRESVVRTLTSSGTTAQQPSKVFLDKETAHQQSRVLTAIMKDYLGPQRLPMAIIDHAGVLNNRYTFSARGAGVLGYSQFGRDHVYLLNESMQINWEAIEGFLARHSAETVLLFGFTYMVWKYLYEGSITAGRQLDFSNSILIHGGSWKKLADQQVSNEEFKSGLHDQFGIHRVHNYYGMVEQTGSVFMECEAGFFHASGFSDVLVRQPESLEVTSIAEIGVLQLLSNVPRSYPGHSLLSEDLGMLIGEDDCVCGRRGKYFLVHGRLPQAELRGCSDTHQEGR